MAVFLMSCCLSDDPVIIRRMPFFAEWKPTTLSLQGNSAGTQMMTKARETEILSIAAQFASSERISDELKNSETCLICLGMFVGIVKSI